MPGFLSAARYEAVKGGPKHLACYELESPAVLESPAYKRVQANPTAWTKRCSPDVIGTTFIRNVYTMIHPEGARRPAVAQERHGAVAADRAHGRAARRSTRSSTPGTTRSTCRTTRRCPASSAAAATAPSIGTPTYLTLYEFEHPAVSESAAWLGPARRRAGDAKIRPHMRHAPGSPGIYVKTFQLRS